MINSPTHARSSSCPPFTSTGVTPPAQPVPQPVPQPQPQPVSVAVGARPSMVSTPLRPLPLPAGGFQRLQSTPQPEDHKALPAASLPTGVFTPLKPEQSLDSSVALVIHGAQRDMAAMRDGFAKLLSTRVAAGVDLTRAATAMLQSAETTLVPAAKDGKHDAAPSAADPVLRAALQAVRSLPSVNMIDVFKPMLAQTGQPDALIRAWFHAQTNKDGEIHGSCWASALEVLAAAASDANKGADWVALGLDGVVSALEDHLAPVANAWRELARVHAVSQGVQANFGIAGGGAPVTFDALAKATRQVQAVFKNADILAGALGESIGRFSPQQLAVAVVRTGQVAAQHTVVEDSPSIGSFLATYMSAALKAPAVTLEQIGRAAAALRDVRMASAKADETAGVMRELVAAIDVAVDKLYPPTVNAVDGLSERSADNIDTQRAIKRHMLKATKPVSQPDAVAGSSTVSQSSSTTTTSSQSSSLG